MKIYLTILTILISFTLEAEQNPQLLVEGKSFSYFENTKLDFVDVVLTNTPAFGSSSSDPYVFMATDGLYYVNSLLGIDSCEAHNVKDCEGQVQKALMFTYGGVRMWQLINSFSGPASDNESSLFIIPTPRSFLVNYSVAF